MATLIRNADTVNEEKMIHKPNYHQEEIKPSHTSTLNISSSLLSPPDTHYDDMDNSVGCGCGESECCGCGYFF